jgi:hypothetical protein
VNASDNIAKMVAAAGIRDQDDFGPKVPQGAHNVSGFRRTGFKRKTGFGTKCFQ